MLQSEEGKVFVFLVNLAPGFNTACVQARDVTDSITLEKVDEEPSIYVLPAVKDRAEGVANWFKLATGFDLVPGAGMWNMMKAMTLEHMMAMDGNQLPEGFLESLNAKLIKIDKKVIQKIPIQKGEPTHENDLALVRQRERSN